MPYETKEIFVISNLVTFRILLALIFLINKTDSSKLKIQFSRVNFHCPTSTHPPPPPPQFILCLYNSFSMITLLRVRCAACNRYSPESPSIDSTSEDDISLIR